MHVVVVEGTLAEYRVPLLTRLAAHCSRLSVVVSRIDTDVEAELTRAGIVVLRLPSLRLQRTWRHPQGFREPNPLDLNVKLPALLRRLRPDVVLSGDMGVRTAWAVLYAKFSPRRCAVVVWA